MVDPLAGALGVVTAFGFRPLPMQGIDPSVVVAAPRTVLAAVSFVLTVVSGGLVVYRYEPRLDRAVDASMSSPLSSVVYGGVAFFLVAFLVAYAANVLASLGVGGTVLLVVAAVALFVSLFSLGGLGFAVVGVWISDLFGIEDPWIGLLGVGALSAVAWLVLPFVYAALVWFAIVAVGIGGSTRLWIHSSTATVDR